MNTGEMIKHYRTRVGMSAETLAASIGVSPSTIYRYENNDIANMGIDKLKAIAQVLNTEAHILLGWEATKTESILSASEINLLNYFREFNEEGQEELIKYARLLASSGQYKKHSESELVEA